MTEVGGIGCAAAWSINRLRTTSVEHVQPDCWSTVC